MLRQESFFAAVRGKVSKKVRKVFRKVSKKVRKFSEKFLNPGYVFWFSRKLQSFEKIRSFEKCQNLESWTKLSKIRTFPEFLARSDFINGHRKTSDGVFQTYKIKGKL